MSQSSYFKARQVDHSLETIKSVHLNNSEALCIHVHWDSNCTCCLYCTQCWSLVNTQCWHSAHIRDIQTFVDHHIPCCLNYTHVVFALPLLFPVISPFPSSSFPYMSVDWPKSWHGVWERMSAKKFINDFLNFRSLGFLFSSWLSKASLHWNFCRYAVATQMSEHIVCAVFILHVLV